MKIILMGSPDFVVPIFDRLADEHEVAAVFTRAPKPVGRKNILTQTPVHIWAEGRGLPVYTSIRDFPPTVRASADCPPSRGGHATPPVDYIIVVAYGVILKQNVLDFATCVNVHYSLLPKYRGAHPVAAAIMNGDTQTGVCLQKMVLELDAGDIFMSEKFPIGENDTTEELRVKASDIAADMLIKFLDAPNDYPPVPQIGEVTFATKAIGEDTVIDWKKTPLEIHNQVRAIGGRTVINGIEVKVLKTRVLRRDDTPTQDFVSGKAANEIYPAPASGGRGEALQIVMVQPAGKKPMAWKDFVNGQRGKIVFSD